MKSGTDKLLLLQDCMNQEFCRIADIVMTKYNIKQGLKCFGQSGVVATDKEMRQQGPQGRDGLPDFLEVKT